MVSLNKTALGRLAIFTSWQCICQIGEIRKCMYCKCTLDDEWQEGEQRGENVMRSTFATAVDAYLCVFLFISFYLLYICKNVLLWILA